VFLIACVTRERCDVESDDAGARDLVWRGESSSPVDGGDSSFVLIKIVLNRLLSDNLFTTTTVATAIAEQFLTSLVEEGGSKIVTGDVFCFRDDGRAGKIIGDVGV
jgi:hypothetical protein